MNTSLIPKSLYQTLIIKGNNMPGFNEILASAKIRNDKYFAYANLKRKWCTEISCLIKEQNIYPIDKLFLHMIWNELNKKRDPDNIASFIKFILDALVISKIIPNDGWKNITGWHNSFIVSKIRMVEVRLYETNKE